MDWSRREFDKSTVEERASLVQVSPHIWKVERDGEPLLIAGIMQAQAIGGAAEIWLLVCEPMKKQLRRNAQDIKDLVRGLLCLYPHVYVQVDAAYPAGQRFAEFMGFTRLTESSRFKNREYLLYEIK